MERRRQEVLQRIIDEKLALERARTFVLNGGIDRVAIKRGEHLAMDPEDGVWPEHVDWLVGYTERNSDLATRSALDAYIESCVKRRSEHRTEQGSPRSSEAEIQEEMEWHFDEVRRPAVLATAAFALSDEERALVTSSPNRLRRHDEQWEIIVIWLAAEDLTLSPAELGLPDGIRQPHFEGERAHEDENFFARRDVIRFFAGLDPDYPEELTPEQRQKLVALVEIAYTMINAHGAVGRAMSQPQAIAGGRGTALPSNTEPEVQWRKSGLRTRMTVTIEWRLNPGVGFERLVVRGQTRATLMSYVLKQPRQSHKWRALLKQGQHAGDWRLASYDTLRRQGSRIRATLPPTLRGYWVQDASGVRCDLDAREVAEPAT